jgi:signal peptidase I
MDITDAAGYVNEARDTLIFRALTTADRLKNVPGITAVNRIIAKDVEQSIFPQINKWNQDNFGPIYIRKKRQNCGLKHCFFTIL